MDIVLHDGSQHHHTRVLHACDRPPVTNYAMFAQRLPIVVAAIGAATAIAACGSHSTHPSGAARPPSQAQVRQDMVSFSRCMRSHGVPDFPDPDSPQRFKAALDPSSSHAPAFQSAQTACRHLLPASRAPRQSAAQARARVTAALAFARCLRGRGFPRFPDPTSTGEMSHEMLTSAGIDVHRPALLRAADACVSVTHGAITKADVARFAAGQ